MIASGRHAKFDDPALNAQIHRLRRVDNRTNLGYLALDYLAIAAVVVGAVGFAESHAGWGLAWGWNVPVFALAIVLMGALQHRLAGLGHEASHYTLLRNKFANDLVADLFCMFPIFSTVHLYRLFHLAHHQYTNDPEHDPDLVNMGQSKQVADFPISRGQFVKRYYLRVLGLPFTVMRYQWDYFYVNSLGKGNNVYMRRVPDGDAHDPRPRLGTALGLAYLVGLLAMFWVLNLSGRTAWIVPAGVLCTAVAVAGVALVPEGWLFRSPFRQPYSARFASALRLSYYTALLTGVALTRARLGLHGALYPWLLWVIPNFTTFLFFLLLRDVYQHANADDGRLTNSRVFRTDPFTRFAVFVYGQDIHVTHHLFPAIPHYNLPALHQLLQESHDEYARQVVECHGTFTNHDGYPTILDVMTAPEPGAVVAPAADPVPASRPAAPVVSRGEGYAAPGRNRQTSPASNRN